MGPSNTPTGHATMSPAIAEMVHYARYLFRKIEPYLGQRIMEIGVGHGTYTPWLLEHGAVLATDIDDECLQRARSLHPEDTLQTAYFDLNTLQGLAECREFAPDSIVCLNVLEHIELHEQSVDGLLELVQPGGTLALIVPAHPSLFGLMDREAGHYRRYTIQSVRGLLTDAGWQLPVCRYINLTGALGWWFHNRARSNAGLEDRSVNQQMRWVDRSLPLLARLTDPWFSRISGLSVLAIARRAP